MEKKLQKKVFVFQIIAFEMRVENSNILEQDTCHQMPMCSQTPQRFHLTLGETFSKSAYLGMMKKMIKRSHGDFASIWDAFTCFLSKRVMKRRFLESGLTKIFRVSNFGNALAMTINFFFKIFEI